MFIGHSASESSTGGSMLPPSSVSIGCLLVALMSRFQLEVFIEDPHPSNLTPLNPFPISHATSLASFAGY